MKKHKYRNLRKKRNLFKNRFFWFSILTIVFLLSICWLLFFSSFFEVKQIEIGKISFSNKQEVEQLSRLFLENKNIFLLKRADLEKQFLEIFPAMENTEIIKKLPNKILIEIKERKPVCAGFSGEDYFFLDVKGNPFKQTELEFIPKTMPLVSLDKEIKEQELEKVIIINELLGAKTKLEPEYYFIRDDKIEVYLLNQSFVLYFSPDKEIKDQVDNLALVLKQGVESKEYIDLRFDMIFSK